MTCYSGFTAHTHDYYIPIPDTTHIPTIYVEEGWDVRKVASIGEVGGVSRPSDPRGL